VVFICVVYFLNFAFPFLLLEYNISKNCKIERERERQTDRQKKRGRGTYEEKEGEKER
jgi:hypothetical protein